MNHISPLECLIAFTITVPADLRCTQGRRCSTGTVRAAITIGQEQLTAPGEKTGSRVLQFGVVGTALLRGSRCCSSRCCISLSGPCSGCSSVVAAVRTSRMLSCWCSAISTRCGVARSSGRSSVVLISLCLPLLRATGSGNRGAGNYALRVGRLRTPRRRRPSAQDERASREPVDVWLDALRYADGGD
jgi:hypothetical protein